MFPDEFAKFDICLKKDSYDFNCITHYLHPICTNWLNHKLSPLFKEEPFFQKGEGHKKPHVVSLLQ